jgi:hypothetical protein
MEESHHNNKYIIELFSIKLGTKKHQINGVELTFTAIGIELFTKGKSFGNYAVNSPHPLCIIHSELITS